MMIWKSKLKASLTLYLTMTVLLSAALILALLESVRVYGMHTRAQEVTNLALESVFGEYQPVLWENFGFLALDKSRNLEEVMSGLAWDNLNDSIDNGGSDLYRMQLKDLKVLSYELVTDRDGAAFEAQVAYFMKREMGEQAAKQLLEKISGIQRGEGNNDAFDEKISSADAAIETVRQEMTNTKKNSSRAGENAGTSVNPIENIRGIRQQGLLSVVVPGQREISGSCIDSSNSLLNRKLEKGNYKGSSQNGWYERILLQKFITTRFKSFLNPEEQGELAYEQEYILCGNNSDKENLEGTAGKLLLLREVANYAYLLTDEAKMAEALALATALAGVSVNPAVIEIVRQGILAAWAWGESIYDIRSLLSGGKVPLLKTSENWKTQLSNLLETMQENSGNTTEEGYSYEEYLQKLLYALSLKHISYRTMDLMEGRIQQKKEYAYARMDEMVDYMSITSDYDVQSIFLTGLGQEETAVGYSIEKKAVFSYIK